jgi:hypothetical protein
VRRTCRGRCPHPSSRCCCTGACHTLAWRGVCRAPWRRSVSASSGASSGCARQRS